MRLAMHAGCAVAFAAIAGTVKIGAQAPAPSVVDHRVLLVPRMLETDTASRRLVRSVARAAIDAPGPLSFVSLKDIDATNEQAVIRPAEWQGGSLGEVCKLVRAGRYVAIVRPASSPDSLRLVIGGPGCAAAPVDSIMLPRAMSPKQFITHLSRALENLAQQVRRATR
jgi:hypothetical protein